MPSDKRALPLTGNPEADSPRAEDQRVDYATFRADLDAAASQDITPRA